MKFLVYDAEYDTHYELSDWVPYRMCEAAIRAWIEARDKAEAKFHKTCRKISDRYYGQPPMYPERKESYVESKESVA